MSNYQKIADWLIKTIIPSGIWDSKQIIKDEKYLFPDFLKKVKAANAEFEAAKGYSVKFVETYRSNALQEQAWASGHSGIRKNGMHHYGIAVDQFFFKDGKSTYDGDYKFLRECMKKQSLYLIAKNDEGHVQYIPVNSDEQNELRAQVDYAIKQFQKSNGLVADGIVGNKTVAKAKKLYG